MTKLQQAGGLTARTTLAGISMTQLAFFLRSNSLVGRPVIDKTGLAGLFNAELEYYIVPALATAAPSAEQVSIFQALERGLGLKLVAGTGEADMLVVDEAKLPVLD